MKIFNTLKNPFFVLTLIAMLLQGAMLTLFFALPDPLGLSLSEMYSGKIIWQVVMAFGTVLAISGIFSLFKSPRVLALFFTLYFLLAAVDYEVYRFNHQRLSYSFVRTYFHPSNIMDSTTLSTLGGDCLGTVLWLVLISLILLSGVLFIVLYTVKIHKKKNVTTVTLKRCVSLTILLLGIFLSVFPWLLFLFGVRGTINFPFKIDWRFTLGKYTLTAPFLHIAGMETVEFIKDDYALTKELVDDLDSFLPDEFSAFRIDANYPGFRSAATYEYRAKKPYNIVFIFGESFKGRILNQMLTGDTLLAPNLWKLSHIGGLWFKNAYSGSYPTVRGTTSTYLGFPSHPNRDVPSFYASNHFKGFPEYLLEYKRSYMTVSNPLFDHTLPFVERFFDSYTLPEELKIEGTADSLGVDAAVSILNKMPTDKNWLLVANTIATHIPFKNYPKSFAETSDDAMVRYRNALRYTDAQLGRLFKAVAERPDFKNTVFIVLGDHDTPVDSLDYKVPQPLGVSAARIFMGIFCADTNLFNGLTIREDVASQLDIGPTVFDITQVRAENHFWGYDLLVTKRPEEKPSLFFTQNAYYLGFRNFALTGGLENEEIYREENGEFKAVSDSLSLLYRKRAISAARVVRTLLRNDTMIPH